MPSQFRELATRLGGELERLELENDQLRKTIAKLRVRNADGTGAPLEEELQDEFTHHPEEECNAESPDQQSPREAPDEEPSGMITRSTRIRDIVRRMQTDTPMADAAPPTLPAMQVKKCTLEGVVTSSAFESFFGALILINAVMMAIETQYLGMDLGHSMGYEGYEKTAAQTWGDASPALEVIEISLGSAFTVELVVKLLGLKKVFFKQAWNYFDALLILCWFLAEAGVKLIFNPLILRLFRLMRLVRLLRIVKHIEAFDSLQVLVGSIMSCLPVLVWATILLVLIHLLVGLVFTGLLKPFMEDEENVLDDRQSVFGYFGTFSRTMVSMFELSLGNWVPICRLLIGAVDERYGLVVLLYKMVVGFAVIKVITGVFLHETFRTAAQDEELMMVQKKRAEARHAVRMETWFNEVDCSGDGTVDLAEFRKVFVHPPMKMWLSNQDLNVDDPDLLFKLIDDGDGQLTINELSRGIARLRGPSRNVDVTCLMHLSEHASALLSQSEERLDMMINELEPVCPFPTAFPLAAREEVEIEIPEEQPEQAEIPREKPPGLNSPWVKWRQGDGITEKNFGYGSNDELSDSDLTPL
eukprot:NODE_2149_length_2282_cov_10.167053.p1 GENE.NODE_2149_length_2282_cov_10.167053~~NODE_2149_length_2282_cov_10.167053.p1  ORF type:complete len:628 (-),score=176.45 NODE_2149_length_2282_cov_10.167053:399-2153(-)